MYINNPLLLGFIAGVLFMLVSIIIICVVYAVQTDKGKVKK